MSQLTATALRRLPQLGRIPTEGSKGTLDKLFDTGYDKEIFIPKPQRHRGVGPAEPQHDHHSKQWRNHMSERCTCGTHGPLCARSRDLLAAAFTGFSISLGKEEGPSTPLDQTFFAALGDVTDEAKTGDDPTTCLVDPSASHMYSRRRYSAQPAVRSGNCPSQDYSISLKSRGAPDFGFRWNVVQLVRTFVQRPELNYRSCARFPSATSHLLDAATPLECRVKKISRSQCTD